jgi:hypothetical protein
MTLVIYPPQTAMAKAAGMLRLPYGSKLILPVLTHCGEPPQNWL